MQTIPQVVADEEAVAATIRSLIEVAGDLPLWKRDQIEAAVAEIKAPSRDLEQYNMPMYQVRSDIGLERGAQLQLVFHTAAQQREVRMCDHAKDGVIRPYLLALSTRLLVCDGCAGPTYLALLADQAAIEDLQLDQACDFCQAEPEDGLFHFRVVEAAHFRMVGYFCDECNRGLMELIT